jgi:ParB/RepB/Spo0J family partition protein
MNDLVRSVKEKGIVTPLLVRPVVNGSVNGKPQSFEIISGHRRFRAAKVAGLDGVPAIVRALDDKDALEIMIIENVLRADVHPLDEAVGYDELIQKHKFTVEELSDRTGKSVSYIYQRLQLCSLIKPAQESFLKEKISAGHAKLLARLQPKDQKEALTKVLKPEHEWDGRIQQTSVEGLRSWIQKNINLDLATACFSLTDPEVFPEAGSCNLCPKRSGFNQDLFNDIQKKDVCTDPTCFHEKEARVFGRIVNNLQDEGIALKDVLAVSTEDSWNIGKMHLSFGGGRVYGKNEYRRAGKGSCKFVKVGVLVQGNGVGESFVVCTEQKCRKHWGVSTSPYKRSPKEIAAQKKADAKRALDVATADALFFKLWDLAKWPLSKEVLHVVARALTEHVWVEGKKYAHVKKLLAKKKHTDAEAARVIVAAVSYEDIRFTRSLPADSPLMRLAKAYRVNVKSVRSGVKRDLDAAAKKEAKGKKRK